MNIMMTIKWAYFYFRYPKKTDIESTVRNETSQVKS